MKRGTSRRTLLSLGVAVPILAATGCGRQPGAAGATAWALTGGSEDATRDSFKAWNKSHPDEKITVEWFANDDYKEKIRTAVGSGNAPTLIFGWAGALLADYVKNKHVIDLTEDVEKLSKRLLPSVAAVGQIDGKTYAVPNNQTQPIEMFYNTEVLGKAKAELPKTWDELLDAVDKLKSADVIPIALAGQSVWPELMWIEYLADRIGGPEAFGRVLDGEKGAWSHPDMLDALDKVTELVELGAFGDNYGSVEADAGADTALVYTGKAGMILHGSWVYPDFIKNAPELIKKDGLAYSTFPTVKGGKGDKSNVVGNPANFWSVSSSATETHRNTGTSYLGGDLFDDDHIDSLLAVGAVPPVTGIEDKIGEADNADYLDFTYGLARDAKHFELSWDQALPSKQAQELLENLSKLFLGDVGAEDFANAMDKTL
ncbi:ABC transporter substrate-binding protein [Stackebrandtia nassauensis]|uniref:Extracellular solute-binding protein family 1 n=1 Tax=Stackebrandtia nassauensis (strain DSM 44728 / CIP 108903 / NRRL B-16338 / NBRC 102104 / LLR-40K-21) TaxID=446470 RepID=D3QBN9_STANL|nr:extracellular solute-binding protein [Stackebrandtia nassauensis]ADD42921.1 extracellular solute-binding protein family 1 [Stackebrandtia nassauensis DSM 44728]